MLLDPRYKGGLFAPEELEAIKQWAIDEARFEPSNPPANTPQPPPPKKARAGPLDVLDVILGAPWCAMQRPPHSHQPHHWWMLNCPRICRPTLSVEQNRRLNGGQHQLLAAEAKRYLSAPPTSVASEHVFSAAGQINTDKRLLPKRWKKSNKNRRKNLDLDFFRFLAKNPNSGIVHHYSV